MKLQQLPQGVYNVAIPKAIADAMGWKKGDDISVTIGGKNKLELSKVEQDD